MEYFKKAYEQHYQDPRTHFNYATRLLSRNQIQLGIQILENMTVVVPQYPRSYQILITFYSEKKQYTDLYRVVNRLFDAFLSEPDYFISVQGRQNLKIWFTFLRDVEKNQKNEKRLQLIEQVLSRL